MFLGFYAIVYLPLADAQAISFSRNLFIVPMASILLAEVIGVRRAVAAAVGDRLGRQIEPPPNRGQRT